MNNKLKIIKRDAVPEFLADQQRRLSVNTRRRPEKTLTQSVTDFLFGPNREAKHVSARIEAQALDGLAAFVRSR